MLTESEEQQVPNYQTRNSKIISNTVLKMPASFSPFLNPLKHRQIAITNDCQKIEENIKEDLSDMSPLILAQNSRKVKKMLKKNAFRSRRKTMLQIIKTINTDEGEGKTNRKYVVMCRYGNEAYTFTQVVSEAYLLENDPELLIDLLTNAKRTCSS